MAASKKEGILGKEKMAAICISNPHGKRIASSGSTEKQVANHLNKSTKSTSTKIVKTIGAHQSERPNTLRRSFSSKSSTTTAPLVREPFTSPAPHHKPTIIKSASFTSPAPPRKPTITKSASFSSLSTTGARKPRVAKDTIVSSSSMTRTRTLNKTPNACPTTKRGTTTTLPSKRTPIPTRGKKETKHENKENLDHQVEEVATHDDKEIPKQHAHVVDEQNKETETLDDISTVSQSNEVPRIEDKFDGSDNNDRHVVDKENDIKEEINVDHEETKIEIHEDEIVEEGCATPTKEKNDEGIESVKEDANSVAKSRIQEEAAQGEEETFEEEAISVGKRQVRDDEEQGTKETVEKEEESRVQDEEEQGKKKTVEEGKNRVRALVGAFETHR